MNPVVDEICRKYRLAPDEFFGRHPSFAFARREAIMALHKEGLDCRQISDAVGCHLQTVYYWLRPERRLAMIMKSKEVFKVERLSGPKQSKKQRNEILAAYLENPAKGTALAVSRGLAPQYAYKLANAMGVIPLTRHPSLERRS